MKPGAVQAPIASTDREHPVVHLFQILAIGQLGFAHGRGRSASLRNANSIHQLHEWPVSIQSEVSVKSDDNVCHKRTPR